MCILPQIKYTLNVWNAKLWVWKVCSCNSGFSWTKSINGGVGEMDAFTMMHVCVRICVGEYRCVCVVMVVVIMVEDGWLIFLPPAFCPKGSTSSFTLLSFTYSSKCLFSNRQNLHHIHIYNREIQSTIRKTTAFCVLFCIKRLDKYRADRKHIFCPYVTANA